MSTKKKTLPQPAPSSSSSYESDEEPHVPQVTQKPTVASTGKTAKKQPLPPPSFSSEEGSDDETEEETESSEHDVPVPTKKEPTLVLKEPTLLKKEQPSAQKEPISAGKKIASTSNVTTLPIREASESESESESESHPEEERSSPRTDPTVSKKRKSDVEKDKEPVSVAPSTVKKLFQRLWTEEDEIGLIKMLIKYKKMHGQLPSTPTEKGVFHELVRNALHIDFSRRQLLSKIRSVRSKYYSNLAKSDNGKSNHHKDHDKLCFELSRKAWGDADIKKVEEADDFAVNGGKDVTENGTAKKRKTKSAAQVVEHETSLVEDQGVHGKFLVSALDEMLTVFPSISTASHKELIKDAIANLEAEKVRSLEHEWRLLNIDQLTLTNKRHAMLIKLLSVITSKLGSFQ